jgi:hypothetical protein
VFWIPGYPGPPAPGPHHRPIFSPGEGRRPKLRRRPSRGGASWGEQRPKLLRTRRPPHEPLLVRKGSTSMSAQRICVQSKRITGRKLRTAHATPDREETNFCRACPPKNSVDGAGRQRKTSASSTHSGGPAPLLYEDYVQERIESTAVLPPWPCVATSSPRR